MRPVVCMITDRGRLGTRAEDALVRRVALAAKAGAHLIQVRERDMTDGALAALVTEIVHATRGTRARVLVNERLDIAMAAGAHGVHLRGDSVPALRVRAVAPSGFLVGRSVHSAAEAARVARDGGVDYLLFGTVFETASKPGIEPAGIGGLSDAVGAVPSIPVLAVGGITSARMRELGASGCAGFAAIGLFSDGPESSLSSTVADVLAPWENRG